MSQDSVSYLVAFTAGALTFFSPCFLPLIPSYIAYMAGISFADLKNSGESVAVRRKVVAHSLLFITGFSIIFVLLGLSATLLGRTMVKYQGAIRIVGGILIMLFGLNLAGILRMGFLEKDKRLGFSAKSGSYLGSILVGVTFAAAWTPCAGPILGSILVMAGTKTSIVAGLKLLSVYSLGLGVPFFLSALAMKAFLDYMNRFKKAIGYINVLSGVFLMIIGALLATGYLNVIAIGALRLFSE